VTITGLDVVMGASVSGESGASELTLKLQDEHGPLASATTTFAVDVARALSAPRELWAHLQTMPVLGKLTVEDRRLDQLPAVIAPSETYGRLRADATLSGTLQNPLLNGKAELSSLRFGDSEHALDVCASLNYDKSSGTFNARGELFQPAAGARACLGTRLARASLGGVAAWQKLHNGSSSTDPAWTASGGISFEGLPIETITRVNESGLRGRLFGAVMFEREAALPQVSAQLEVRDTVLDRAQIGTARLGVRSDGRTLSSNVRISEAHGSLSGSLLSTLDWDGPVPTIDTTSPVTANLKADSVDAVLLAPFLQDVLSDVSGKLDANLTARFVAGKTGLEGGVVGTLRMRQGTMKLARLALPLKNVDFSARAEQKGQASLITIDSLSASAQADRPNLSARASLLLTGFRISKGNANVTLRDVPLLVEGQTLATLSGKQIAIALERRPTEMYVALDIPELDAALPNEGSRQLIELSDSPDVAVAQPIAEPRREADPTSLPWRLRFNLGNDVRLSRAELLLPVSGSPEIVLGDETVVRGAVELRAGGRLLLPGIMRAFTIESGSEVSFEGQNDDPRLSFTAATDLPQLHIRAVVRGTFKNPEIHWESDPFHSEDEIKSALLSGSADESTAPGDQSVGNSATNYFGQQLGQKVLGNTALSNLEIKTGSETTADQRSYSTYTASYPITENLWFEGSYKTLQTPDPTEPNANAFSGTFDWRFRRNWSLRTELGNIGAGLDLLWMYRY
jgi:autotransporter translocation and assembly factor TamB